MTLKQILALLNLELHQHLDYDETIDVVDGLSEALQGLDYKTVARIVAKVTYWREEEFLEELSFAYKEERDF